VRRENKIDVLFFVETWHDGDSDSLQHLRVDTHDLGGLLDVMVTRNDLTRPSVEVLHVGLSVHRLLQRQALDQVQCTTQ